MALAQAKFKKIKTKQIKTGSTNSHTTLMTTNRAVVEGVRQRAASKPAFISGK